MSPYRQADLSTDAAMRSFYLESAPPRVQMSLRHVHLQAERSVRLEDKVHTDCVLTYLAEVIRLAQELRVIVESHGLDDEDES